MLDLQTRFTAFWLVVWTIHDRQLPTTNKHPGIWSYFFLLLMAECEKMAKRRVDHSVVCLWNFFFLSKSMASPWILKIWSTYFSVSVFFLTMDILGNRQRSVSFPFMIRCSPRCDWSEIRERSSKAWKIDSFFFPLLPLACSSGADCGVGEYCNRCK